MSLAGCAPGAHPDVISAALGALRLSPDSAVACWNDAGIALAVCGDSVLCRENHLALLLDGRIDNYPEIAAGLGREKVSGPQLLLHAYLRWGADFPRYVLGDFALALYDARDRRLLLARDAGGYRPLYYWARGEKFRFASEARGLLAAGDIPLALDERRIAHWLSMLPADPGETFFSGILAVPAGYTLVRERGHIALHRFWEPEKIPLLRLRDPREYAEGLRCVLRQAVKDRIPPSARAGSHLSGGLDSSSITATAAQLLARRGARLTAFTAVPAVPMDDSLFPGCFCDESSHAAATVALYPGADHVLIPTNAYGVFEILDGMSSAAECPQLNPWNSIWIYAICREARRRGLDVLLTGANGNFTISWDGRGALPALVADGRLMAAARLARALRRRGRSWRAILAPAALSLVPAFGRRSLERFRRMAAMPIEDATGLRPEFAGAFGISSNAASEVTGVLNARSLRIWSFCRNDFGGHMAGLKRLTGIDQTDPASDRRVVDFCLSVPEEHYCRDGLRRSLIRDAMADALPPQVLKERRLGRQSADFLVHLAAEKEEVAAELARLENSDLARRCLNLPRLHGLLQSWPEPPYSREQRDRFCLPLMRGISMGRFIRRAEEGVLFRDRALSSEVLPAGAPSR